MTISKPQKAILHVGKAKLGWDDDLYRQGLVTPGFEAVMGFAEYCGFRPLGKGAPRYGERPGMATYAQIELIRELWRELHHARECDDAARAGWPLKDHKVHSRHVLTLDAARKAIAALKARKVRPRSRAV